jgi:hypothetical protein
MYTKVRARGELDQNLSGNTTCYIQENPENDPFENDGETLYENTRLPY